MNWVRETPGWVWVLALAFACVPPFTHAMIAKAAPKDVVPTGLHKPDSAIFLHSMQMFETGFYSPYATCKSPAGSHSPRYYPAPFHWMYGTAGSLGATLGLTPFIALGVANACGVFFFLLAIYHFYRTTFAARADAAFVLYACAGGLGGVLYLVCFITGATESDVFSRFFYRFAIYDLVEGSNLASYLLAPRFYYAMPLAIGFAGLTTFIVARAISCPYHLVFAWSLLFVATFLNMRFAPAYWALGALYSLQHAKSSLRDATLVAVPIAAGICAAVVFMMRSPAFLQSTGGLVQQAMWFSSFLSAALPLLIPAAFLMYREFENLPRAVHLAASAGLGYVTVFACLFTAHQLYFGSVWRGSDHAAALAVSDIALSGAAIGGAMAWIRGPRTNNVSPYAWYFAATALFTAVAISAAGAGWLLQFAPQRLMIFIGVLLAPLAAEGIATMREGRPRVAKISVAFIVVCAVTSFAVSTLVFQGPLGMRPGAASDLGMRAAYLTRNEAECLARLTQGSILAPRPLNDALSLRAGIRVLGGFGAADLSDQPAAAMDAAIEAFYSTDMSAEERAQFLSEWCVQYVFVPETHGETINELEALPQLMLVNSAGDARLYRVE